MHRGVISSSARLALSLRSQSTKSTIAAANDPSTIFPDEWSTAKSYDDIPGFSRLQLIRAFLPGGMLNNTSPIELQQRCLDTFGPIFRFPGILGNPNSVFTLNPAHFETVYRTEGIWPVRRSMEVFQYYRTRVRPDVFKGYGGLVFDQGEPWQKLRSAINPMLMSPKVIGAYLAGIDAVTRDFVRKVHLLRDSHTDEMPATFANEMQLWALESIGTIALDRRLGVMAHELDEDANLMIRSVNDFFRIAYNLEVQPPLWKYYATKDFKRLMSVFDDMTRLVQKYVDESLAMQKAGTADGNEDKSVFQKLLRSNPDFAFLTTFDMFFAGIDTTSAAAAALLYLLAKNPIEQEKLRAEVHSVLPDRQKALQTNDLERMRFMRACIKESMRMHSIVSGHLRASGQNLVLDGYQIPMHTDVIMCSSVLMNSDQYFADSSEFQPERWLRDATGQKTTVVNPFTYLPFGFGARSCVGRRLAEMEMQVLVARLLRDYRIEWHHGPMQFATTMLTTPSSELKFKFVPL